jgi:sulfur-oxidizing protein SoxA
MQDDDTVNPATLWVLDGEALWNQKASAADRSCADCHGDATVSMTGVAARYPAFSPAHNAPIDLEQRINLCRIEHQRATPLPFESHDLLALTVYVGRQSRGMPIAEVSDERLKSFIDRGRELFTRRQGQINLSCAQCHDENWGKRVAGALLPQGHLIRSTAWNGKASGRCSAGCATASSACALNSMLSARANSCPCSFS